MKDDPAKGCGISWLWFDKYDAFKGACLLHDNAFDQHAAGEPTVSRKEVDKAFLEVMLRESEGKPLQTAKAYTYYTIVRAVGWLWW